MVHGNQRLGFEKATFVPSHGVRSGSFIAIMVDLDARYSIHKFVQVEHDRIPQASGLNKSTST